jgi:Putative Actinobacterial Holin-X, holin superfamily III
MPTRDVERQGVGESAKLVAEHASAIARLELELAAGELKRKVAALGIGIGMAIGGAVFALFALGFGLAAAAAAIATAVPTWAALLIVTGALFVLAGLLATLGLGAIRRGTPPVPEQAIEEAKLTTQALRSDGSR